MFIKKYVKNEKVYFMLVIVEQTKKGKKPHFINCFIPEQLANMLIKCGLECKSRNEE